MRVRNPLSSVKRAAKGNGLLILLAAGAGAAFLAFKKGHAASLPPTPAPIGGQTQPTASDAKSFEVHGGTEYNITFDSNDEPNALQALASLGFILSDPRNPADPVGAAQATSFPAGQIGVARWAVAGAWGTQADGVSQIDATGAGHGITLVAVDANV